jgi:hypothetical protein
MVGTTTSPIAARIQERTAPRAGYGTAPRAGYGTAPRAGYSAVPSRAQPPEQPSPAALPAHRTDRDRAAPRAGYGTAPQRTPDARPENGVPSWKRRILDALASELERRGASRGSRVREEVTDANVDARIASLTSELRARAQDRTGYKPPGAARVGVVVNRAV